VSLLIKLLIAFPRLAEALRSIIDRYEEHLYVNRHRNMRDVIDDWMQSDSSSDKSSLLYQEARSTGVDATTEGVDWGDVTPHKRLGEQCPLNVKDCPCARNINPTKED
jgi:hypothetical protein